MTEVNYIMWNCSGVNPTDSTKEKLDFLEITTKNKFDVLVLVETHHKKEDDFPPQINRYRKAYHVIHSEATEDDSYAGVITIISKDFDILQTKEIIQGRLLHIKIKHKITEKEYNIFPFYGHTTKKATPTQIQFIAEKLEINMTNGEKNNSWGF